jgi:ubiquinone/menaquinone biosynthesis C-methylase UbiE
MDKPTIDTYNKMAKEYDEETTDFWERFPRTFLDNFVERSGRDIIDIGSGPGRDGLLLKNAGKNVTCLDASEAMVEASTQKGLHSLRADFDNIPFEDNTFDAVWSYTALLHVPKKSINNPLREIARILKPKGIFALGLIEGDNEEYKESLGVGMPRWFSYYRKDEVVKLCNDNGFTLVYFETLTPRTKNYLNFIFEKR